MQGNASSLWLAVGALAATNLLLAALLVARRREKQVRRKATRTPSSEALAAMLDTDLPPPLPHPIPEVLHNTCLAYLATSSADNPHLSLMRFSYCKSLRKAGGEVLVLSTQRATKKYATLKRNENVALLVHGFQADRTDTADAENYDSQRFSITLNGKVHEEEGALAERYREIHLSRNERFSQFIVGDDVAIVTVELTSARVCDVNDRVQHWSRASGRHDSWEDVNAPASGRVSR
jgi:hypothetical protein